MKKRNNKIGVVYIMSSELGVCGMVKFLMAYLESLAEFTDTIEINGIPFLIETLQMIVLITLVVIMLFLGFLLWWVIFKKDSE